MERKTKKIQFKAREGSILSDENAVQYGAHILKMMKKRTVKSVTASDILQDARSSTTPYHDYFDWDDSSAAEKHRLDQARQLIASIVEIKIIHEEEVPMRVFVNVVDEQGQRAYIQTDYAMVRPRLANQVISQALREVKTWSNKYKEYKELARIRNSIISTQEEFIIEED